MLEQPLETFFQETKSSFSARTLCRLWYHESVCEVGPQEKSSEFTFKVLGLRNGSIFTFYLLPINLSEVDMRS